MHIRSLKHILEVVIALTHPRRVTVFGSSALLGVNSGLGEPGGLLETSFDADLLIEPYEEEQSAVLHETVGEGSIFHRQNRAYVDVLRPEIKDTLPGGWERRCVSLAGFDAVRCIGKYDLAIVKLILGREKDKAVLKGMIQAGVINIQDLRAACQKAPLNDEAARQAGKTLHSLAEYTASGEAPSVMRERRAIYRRGRKKKCKS